MIRSTERHGLFFGLHFSSACVSISHIFFANDSIIFCKANLPQVKVVKKVLQNYAKVSDQELNFQKSALFFDKFVPSNLQESIIAVLGITKTGDCGSYLGLPYLIGRSKK